MELEHSKLVMLLKSLNKSEFEKLENYIFSPFFNTSVPLSALFKILAKKYPDFDTLDKDSIYRKIYPGESYRDKRLRDLFSRLLKLVEEFLAQLEFMKDKRLIDKFILHQLAKKNLEKHFIHKSNEAEQHLDKEKIVSTEYFFNKYSIFKEKRSYLEILKTLGKRTPFFEDITKEMDLFVIYSVYNILKYGLTLQTHEKVLKHKYDFKMLDEVLGFIKTNPLNDYPVIMIYYYIIILNREESNDSIYFELIKLLNNNFNFLEEDDQRIILVLIFNYTKIQAIKGKSVFRKENYRILKETIEKGLHPLEGNYFPESSYITIVGTGLQEKDLEWTENFMNKYKESLHPDQKENAYTYCTSILNYRRGNYGEALKGLSRVSIDDFYYHLRVKNHELKIYYELGDYDSTGRIIDSFRHFLSTTKYIPDYVRVRFVSYVNFLGRIVNVQLGGERGNLIDIEREIIRTDQEKIENKTWLLEQINKIKI
jgi:hypothetical protein